MARNSKNWSEVSINGVAFSKRPTKIGKGEKGVLVGYAQVPIIPDDLSEADAQQLLTEWLDDGVLGHKQTLIATINALAVQTQAAVRRKYNSAVNGTFSDDELFNKGFFACPKDELAKIVQLSDSERRQALISKGRETVGSKLSTPESIKAFAETNIVTSDNTMSTEDDSVQQQ